MKKEEKRKRLDSPIRTRKGRASFIRGRISVAYLATIDDRISNGERRIVIEIVGPFRRWSRFRELEISLSILLEVLQ